MPVRYSGRAMKKYRSVALICGEDTHGEGTYLESIKTDLSDFVFVPRCFTHTCTRYRVRNFSGALCPARRALALARTVGTRPGKIDSVDCFA